MEEAGAGRLLRAARLGRLSSLAPEEPRVAGVPESRHSGIRRVARHCVGACDRSRLIRVPNSPTPGPAAIWGRFWKDFLPAPIQRWNKQEWDFDSELPE